MWIFPRTQPYSGIVIKRPFFLIWRRRYTARSLWPRRRRCSTIGGAIERNGTSIQSLRRPAADTMVVTNDFLSAVGCTVAAYKYSVEIVYGLDWRTPSKLHMSQEVSIGNDLKTASVLAGSAGILAAAS